MNPNALEADLDEILERSSNDLASLSGAHLFVTGGTGFVGSWLLETLAWANARRSAGIRATVLTRDPQSFAARSPHLANAAGTTLVRGDVRAIPSDLGPFDGVVHAATPASADLNRDEPLLMLDTIVEGGRNVLDVAARSGAIPFLFTSSGAVYGAQPADVPLLSEEYTGAPDPLDPRRAYHEGKRIAELQCALYAQAYGIKPKIARLFAFVGPYLPLDRHFAIGNFIRDAIAGGPIALQGDGTTIRSYQYASEMIVWLLAILVRGVSLRAYNVGSDAGIDMRSLAQTVADAVEPRAAVTVAGTPIPGKPVDRYVPSTQRARSELALEETISLREGIQRTARFHRAATARL
jgi:nucleoside-diphosphate-sugar epimerase